MNEDHTERDYKIARRRVNQKKAFYSHLSGYIAVGLFFFGVNISTGGNWWFQYPMLVWGIGLMIHYFTMFGIPGVVSYEDGWEERAIEEELQKIKRHRPSVDEPQATEPNMELKELEKQEAAQKRWDDSQIV